MPSHEPLNRPGRIELLTSATTVTVIVVGVTPTSVLLRVADLQASFAGAVDEVAPPRPFPAVFLLPPPLLPHAVTTSTKAVARTHQRSRILSPPGSLEGRSVRTLCTPVDPDPGRGLRERSARLPDTLERRDDSAAADSDARCRCH